MQTVQNLRGIGDAQAWVLGRVGLSLCTRGGGVDGTEITTALLPASKLP